jgi:biopolymer transport protein ExbD
MAINRRRKRIRGSDLVAMPSLTSLIDIMTVLLVFLLKTFATSPIEVTNPSVHLPHSSSRENVKDLVIVMITGAERREPGREGQRIVAGEVPTIVVDDDVILHLEQDFSVPEGSLERQFIIRPLKQKMLEVRKLQGVTADITEKGEGFTGEVVIVADQQVPYDTLSKVLASLAEAGYGGFKFAIVKLES